MAILREAGIQGLSQVQVARRANVRQSHVTYYFPKRHDLIEAVAVRFVDGGIHYLSGAAAGSAAGDAGALLQHIAAAITDRGHMRMFAGVIVEADHDPELRAVMARLTLRLQSALAERLGGGDDAMERAGLVLASLWGLGLYGLVVRPKHRSALASLLLDNLAASVVPRRGGAPKPS
jgi:DNA-binding transcriptional regulator YbjK